MIKKIAPLFKLHFSYENGQLEFDIGWFWVGFIIWSVFG